MAAFDFANQADPVIIDLSADYRFDPSWYYGLPELTRARHAGQRRISNPGCYATAMQLAIAPMLDVLDGPVQCFGVSGYSGAGTTPSDKNDPGKLRDNLMPYALTGHVHEREVSTQLHHPVEFMPGNTHRGQENRPPAADLGRAGTKKPARGRLSAFRSIESKRRNWSGRQDLNLRLLRPERSALPG